MDKIISVIVENRLYASIVIIIIGVIIYQIIEKTINKLLERDKKNHRIDKKGKTIFKLTSNIAKYVIFLIIIVLILQVYGVNVNSLVAGLGIVSVIVGLAIQDPIKDIITGMNIVSDEYFVLGDIVRIDEIEGKVIHLGIRTTKVQDILNGNVYVIANRNISKAIKVSNELYLDVPLSYEDDTSKLEEILRRAAETIAKIEDVKDAKYIGINEFANSAIIYKMKILCKPDEKLSIKRKANRIIKAELDKNGISIPYPQLTIHSK